MAKPKSNNLPYMTQAQVELKMRTVTKRDCIGDIISIADPQIIEGCPITHLQALAKYIWKHQPAHIVHIGDHFDFESLSTYASGLEKEGRRLANDLSSGEYALAIIPEYIKMMNRKHKKTAYKPTMDFIAGNHEHRLSRMVENNPHLAGMIDLPKIVTDTGWTYHNFLSPLWLGNICMVHYLQNDQSGRPVGGSIENKLNKFPHSFVHGHQQQMQIGRRQNLLGKPHFGVCAGSFYMHDEGYRGACNTEIRGFVHLKEFTNRYNYQDHDVEFVSLERLLNDYK